MLAHVPRLRTLLLSDGIYKSYKLRPYKFGRDVALQRAVLASYEAYAPALRRVAFTTDFEWEKGADGWWYLIEGEDPEMFERRMALQVGGPRKGEYATDREEEEWEEEERPGPRATVADSSDSESDSD